MTDTLAERDVALTTVSGLLDAAARGHGRALFVVGEAGLGKTAVLEYAISVAGGRFRLGVGRADVAEAALPFGLMGQALDAVLEGPARLDPPPGSEAGPDLGRYLYTMLGRLREQATGPLLLALDDAHWADPDSLTLLRLICRRIGALPVAVLVTARPWPPNALRAGEELAEQGLADVRALSPLSPAAAATMLSDRAGIALPDPEAARLAGLCAGNPLLLDRVASAIRAGHRLPEGTVGADASWARRLLLSHLAGLDGSAQRFVRAAAVLGRRFRPEVAAEMAGLNLAAAAAAQEAVTGAGLVTGAGAGWAEFSHDLVRQAVYELAAPVRAGLHEAAFRALVARQANPAEAAGHVVAARLAGDRDAIEVVAGAGREALRAGAIGAAQRHLRAAVALAGTDAPAELLCDLGQALMAGGHHAAAAALYQDLISREPVPPALRYRALSQLSLARIQERRFDEADACLEEALRLAGPAEPDLATAAAVNHAVHTMLNRSITAGLPLATRARDLAAQSSSPVRAAADSAWAWCAYLAGHPEALEVTGAAASAAAGTGSRKPAGTPWWDPVIGHAMTAVSAERYDDAERRLRDLVDAAERRSDPMTVSRALSVLATCLWRRGRLDEAGSLCDRLAEAAEVVPVTFPLAATANAIVLLELGREDEAAGWCDRLAEAARHGTGFRMSVTIGYHPRALLALRRGDTGQACATFAALEELSKRHGIADPCFIPWAGDAITSYLAAGQLSGVRRVIAWLNPLASIYPATWPKAVLAAAQAALAERDGDPERARDHFDRARDLASQTPMPLFRSQILTGYGAFLTRRGDPRGARPVLAESLRIAEDCGATWQAGQARAEWRRAGGRAGTTPPGQLTPQEAAVARLARSGQTNKEIAAQLYLSVNTVETHLAHVYQKLGISRRRQLATLPDGSQAETP
jgi:DNA-binding CsgD family transcriptional regulator/tetratricopeptide (TPR) repeat protein